MSGFYGRGKAETFLTFDKIYPNYTALKNAGFNDGVFISRYVLVEYGDNEYDKNLAIDGGIDYDSTIWKKTSTQQKDGTYYIKIADLNSINPTFNIESLDPVDEPGNIEMAYKESNNSYTIKMPKPWGFAIKENGIDFNEEGFNPDQRSVTDAANIIAVETSADKQKKELSILLPGVGNAVAKMWDIVYGEQRNTIIDWDSNTGLKLVDRDEHGQIFNPNNVATVAGCINSVQDLIGKIVVDDVNAVNHLAVEDASTDKIYFRTENGVNGFYIKDRTY
jgi:hypothetical protein